MSTISTQLNLGASYLVNDFYQRFLNRDATEKQLVSTGRWITVLTMAMGISLGLTLQDAGQAFDLLLLLGAGTGLIYILRWFWWRINAYTEIVAMVSSMIIAGYLTFVHDRMGFLPLEGWQKTILGAVLTTLIWIASTYLTPATKEETLIKFYKHIQPGGPGWKRVVQQAQAKGISMPAVESQLPLEILCMFIGCITVYGALFATGFWIYGQTASAGIATAVALGGGLFLLRAWNSLRTQAS